MKIAVFASGKGTNLQALIDASGRGKLGAGRITLVVSDREEAFALERARKAGIKTFVPGTGTALSREDYDAVIAEELEKEGIDLIALAGFMRILSAAFVRRYEGKILNIHPSLLPAFRGCRGIKDAYDHGVKITGVTVHFVDEGLDSGPIVLQEPVPVAGTDTLEDLEERIHEAEHRLYPEAVRLLAGGRLEIRGRKVKILGE